MSSLLLRTLREDPADAELPGHRLLVRAGYVRRVSAGVYSWLPLGQRTLNRIIDRIRHEMDRIGDQEVLMPALLPRDLYERSGRFAEYGDLLFQVTDRRGARHVLGPTHEELVTQLVAGEISSYRSLPLSVYQIQTKYRDEARARSGPLRGREFLMKDAYSFDLDQDGLQRSYERHRTAYEDLFDGLGLSYRVVHALSGPMGGSHSEEFLALTDSGEDTFVACSACDYAANTEAASIRPPEPPDPQGTPAMQTVYTPGAPGIEDVVAYFAEHLGGGLSAAGMLKSIVFRVDGQPAVVLVPGDREVDEERLAAALAPAAVEPFGEADFADRPDLVRGYVGPQEMAGRGVAVYGDVRVAPGTSWVTGANRADHHVRDAVAGRDFTVDRVVEVVTPRAGDPCSRCARPLRIARGIEIGHVFQIGTKFAEAMGLTVLGPDGTPVTVTMGCYGIGVGRLLATMAEQFHDARGLRWPERIGPYDVHVVAAGRDHVPAALDVGRQLSDAGFEVLVDDRAEASAGVKFTDAELLGMPHIVVVGRAMAQGMVELRDRHTDTRVTVPVGDVARTLAPGWP